MMFLFIQFYFYLFFDFFNLGCIKILCVMLNTLSGQSITAFYPCQLHGPSMFAVKAKIYGALYKQSSSIAFDETSSYWSAPKNS